MPARTESFSVPVDPTIAFQAALAVIEGGKYDLGGQSNEQLRLIAKSGKTAMSWGHYYAVEVVPDASGSSVRVTSDNPPNAPKALMDGRKNTKAAAKLSQAIQEQIQTGALPPVQPRESFMADDNGSPGPWQLG